MEYFAKYLPVEGEIKEGDYFIAEDGCVWQFCIKDHFISHKWKKAKLFLCSRDIQVGDKVQFQLVPNKTEWKELELLSYDSDENTAVLKDGELLIHTTPDQWCFKVLGEISPKATWVKEGDEFEEKDIRPLTEYNGKRTNHPYHKLIHYQIKGLCGHFH